MNKKPSATTNEKPAKDRSVLSAKPQSSRRNRTKIVVISLLLAIPIFLAVAFLVVRFVLPGVYFATNIDATEVFPTLSDQQLSLAQSKILNAARSAWETPKPDSYYIDIPTDEPWCANFVSYIFKEAGFPFVNPHTGSWRIPGIYTLREYLIAENVWHGTDYSPVPGDIVIYNGGVLGGHTNIVLQTDGETITTIGGNENNALKIRTINFKNPIYGVIGFGHIE